MIEGISQVVRGQEAEAECQVRGRPGPGGREVARISGRNWHREWHRQWDKKTRSSENDGSPDVQDCLYSLII